MFGKWLGSLKAAPDSPEARKLGAVVARELPGADSETIAVVTSIVGLLGAVAYADRNYSAEEEHRVRRELGRIHGLTQTGIDAICNALREQVREISTVQAPRYSRTLLELADVDLRREVLGALVGLAAADASISVAETNLLRQITTSLGLEQQDYLEFQSKHRDHLESLKRSPEG